MGQGFGTVRMSGEEAGQFTEARFTLNPGQMTTGAAVPGFLGQASVVIGTGRDLREVGHGQDLMATPQVSDGGSHGEGRFASDTGIHLVQHEGEARIGVGSQGHAGSLEGQHETAQLAPAGDLGQGPKAFARVGFDPERQCRETRRSDAHGTPLMEGRTRRILGETEPSLEAGSSHAEGFEAPVNFAFQNWEPLGASSMEVGRGLHVGLGGSLEAGFQFRQGAIAFQEVAPFGFQRTVEAWEVLGFAAVAPSQAFVVGQTLFDGLQSLRTHAAPVEGLVTSRRCQVLGFQEEGSKAIAIALGLGEDGEDSGQGPLGGFQLGQGLVEAFCGLAPCGLQLGRMA